MSEWVCGRIRWFRNDKGYGFVDTVAFDRPLFVHYTDISKAYKELSDGECVRFQIEDGEKGPRAKEIHTIDEDFLRKFDQEWKGPCPEEEEEDDPSRWETLW